MLIKRGRSNRSVDGLESKRGLVGGYLLVGLVAAVAGFSIFQMAGQAPIGAPSQTAFALPEDLVGRERPDFSLPDTQGQTTSISRWDGDVVLVNFWATWCAPCRKEMPAFAELQDQYGQRGFQVVGVAIDRPNAVDRFTASIGTDYPQLIALDAAIAVADRYGNQYGGLPYSVLIDRQGIVRFVKAGELSKQELETELLSLL